MKDISQDTVRSEANKFHGLNYIIKLNFFYKYFNNLVKVVFLISII